MHIHFEAVLARQDVDTLAARCLAVFALGVVAAAFDLVGATGGARALDPTLAIIRRLQVVNSLQAWDGDLLGACCGRIVVGGQRMVVERHDDAGL